MERSKNKGLKTFRKGDVIFEAGSPADRLFVIQQGLVSISVKGFREKIELYKATPPQIIGIECLHNIDNYQTTATAMNDTSAVEISKNEALKLISGAPQAIKMVLEGMLQKEAALSGELTSLKTEVDIAPCPLEKLPKTFAVVYHVARYTGKKKDEIITVNWPSFRKYCQRVFLESPVRLEQMMYMLVNLGLAEMQFVQDETDPEAPEDLGFIHFSNIEQIGAFSEFFRKNPKGNPDAQGTIALLMKEISFWNQNILPRGMPTPPDPNSKFPPPPKKKAA